MYRNISLLLALLGIVIAILVKLDTLSPIYSVIIAVFPSTSSSGTKYRLFTKDELSVFTGKDGSDVYLAILGDVFDVTKGRQHYGEGGGYHFFTGKDGTRAFVTGDFTSKGLIEDSDGLSHSDYLGLEEWNNFYQKGYKHIGKLIGHYYDNEGNPTAAMLKYEQNLKEAKEIKLSEQDDMKRFPPCNFEYRQGHGRRAWCSNLSGGIKRDWVGLPRQYFQPGKTEPRCACVKDKGPPSGSDKNVEHNDRGDLDNPLMKLYEECDENSFECLFKE